MLSLMSWFKLLYSSSALIWAFIWKLIQRSCSIRDKQTSHLSHAMEKLKSRLHIDIKGLHRTAVMPNPTNLQCKRCSYVIVFHLSPVSHCIFYLHHFSLNIYTNNRINIILSFYQKTKKTPTPKSPPKWNPTKQPPLGQRKKTLMSQSLLSWIFMWNRWHNSWALASWASFCYSNRAFST